MDLVGVAIPAAGGGQRMGGRSKAFLPLAGEPLLLRTLRPFLARRDVAAVAVALPARELDRIPAWLEGLDARMRFARGGATRLLSVLAALEALPDEVGVILVHDAARPLVTDGIIERCLAVASVEPRAGLPCGISVQPAGASGSIGGNRYSPSMTAGPGK
jgi:2-C-methyl-D-erythritol 4-phosphate cytidylyltransferase